MKRLGLLDDRQPAFYRLADIMAAMIFMAGLLSAIFFHDTAAGILLGVAKSAGAAALFLLLFRWRSGTPAPVRKVRS